MAKKKKKPKKPVKKAPNTLKMDPTRTSTLRRRYMQALGSTVDGIGTNARKFMQSPRWLALPDDQKLKEFELYLRRQTEQGLLTVKPGQTHWQAYVVKGYEAGLGRAFTDVKKSKAKAAGKSAAFFQGGKSEFVSGSLRRPVPVNRLKMLVSRNFTELKGVTDQMATRMTRTLADGLTKGEHPNVIAKALSKDLGIAKSNAQRIARTEIIRAHAEGSLDGLEDLGVKEVGVAVEWATAGHNVCELCAVMEGVVLSIEESRGMIPRHPNCRCAFIPANVGEDQKGQVRKAKDIRKAINKSLKAQSPKKSLKEIKKKASWLGADKKIIGKRPKSIF